MYVWKNVVTGAADDVAEVLNALEAEGWELFSMRRLPDGSADLLLRRQGAAEPAEVSAVLIG